MEKFMKKLEQLTPFFNKFAQNKYIKSIMNGFMASIAVTLISSVFIMINTLPNSWGYYWPEAVSTLLMVPYNFSMGLIGLILSLLIAKSLVNEVNREMPEDKQLDQFSTSLFSMISFIIFVRELTPDGALNISNFGSPGIFVAILTSIISVNIFAFCIKKDIVIKLPKEVPPGLSKTFRDVIAGSVSLLLLYGLDILIRTYTGSSIVVMIMNVLSPIFAIGDSYIGLFFIMFSVSALTWIGIHGSSVVLGAISPLMMMNLATNQELAAQGLKATETLTGGIATVGLLGGSGATLMVTFLFAFLAKSKANKSVGRAALVPGNFMVNEPILFGGPVLMNPYFFIPYLLTPAVNVLIYKFFIDVLGMGGATMSLAMGTPMLVSVVAVHNFAPLAFLLLAVLVAVDTLAYLPFFLAYDKSMVKNELENGYEENVVEEVKTLKSKDGLKVLVLCQAGGTSSLLANAINKGAQEGGSPIKAKANTVNSVVMANESDTDLLVLSPQARSYYDYLKDDCDKYGIKLVTTKGAQYINLSQDSTKAVNFVITEMEA